MTAHGWSQEVVIAGYPKGVAGSVSNDFFEPVYSQLQEVADVLNQNPTADGIITGVADGYKYHKNNDTKNPGLALGRAHVLKQLMIEKFCVDSTQLIIQSTDVKVKGDEYRYSSIRVRRELPLPMPKADTVYLVPQIQVKEIHHNYYNDEFGLKLGLGVTSTPSGIIPFVSGAVVYKKWLYIEGLFGHTFWSDSRDVAGKSHDTWSRFTGGQLVIFPFEKKTVGFSAGWIRLEEISQHHYKYALMSEGLTMGIRFQFFENFELEGKYFPNKQRLAEMDRDYAVSKKNQWLISVSYNLFFGGEK
ncbi:MAG: hypothetical protein ACNFW9_04880 [Candidatus Kerfeldbacteria bacterium]